MPILFKNGYCDIPLMKGCSAHFHNKVPEKHDNYLWNIYCVLTDFCFTQCFPSVYDYRTLLSDVWCTFWLISADNVFEENADLNTNARLI